MTREDLQRMVYEARMSQINRDKENRQKSDFAHMVLLLMDTDEYSENYCGSLRVVLSLFPEVDREELESELNNWI